MKTFLAYCSVLVISGISFAQAHSHIKPLVKANHPAKQERKQPLVKLPPLQEGVTQLKFEELFNFPVGSRGLEISAKARGLEGKLVRILGFMVEQTVYPKDYFLLTASPLSLDEEHFSNDLPPATISVKVKVRPHEQINYKGAPMLLTGKLSLEQEEQADGRLSAIRLLLEESSPTRPYRFTFPKHKK